MKVLETLTEGNKHFSKSAYSPHLKILPALKTLIIGCVDPRVEPSELFALRPGDAAIIRNVGGRVFPSTLETLELLATVAHENDGALGAGWILIVLHHTDRGISALMRSPEGLAHHFGVSSRELPRFAITDPFESVQVDVAPLTADPRISSSITISGLVYDVGTGLVSTVVPPHPTAS